MMFERSPDDPLPLVYACSGCSNVAQLANDLALRLDRARLAEMSCIAGVGDDYRNLRPKYVEAFWNLVNWDFVAKNFAA